MSNKVLYKGLALSGVKQIEVETEEGTSQPTRRFKGIASSSTEDRSGEILLPEGAVFTLPLSLLLHHDLKLPVGQVITATVENGQIVVEFELPEITEEGALKDRVDEAYQSLVYGLIRGLSVGFIVDDSQDSIEIDSLGRLVFKKWEWFELSLVTVPCNRDSTIEDYKKDVLSALSEKTCNKEKVIVKSHKVVKLNAQCNKGAIKL